MGSFPHELPGYRHVKNADTRAIFEQAWGVDIDPEPGLRIPNMLDAAVGGQFKGLYCQGEISCNPIPIPSMWRRGWRRWSVSSVHDLFLNETANYAHVFLPGSTFLEKEGTFTNAERRINRVREVMKPRNGYADWEITQMLANAILKAEGRSTWHYTHPAQIMEEIAATTPRFPPMSTTPCWKNAAAFSGPATMPPPRARRSCMSTVFVRGKGRFIVTEYVATEERTGPRILPLLLTTGRILSQYNVGAQTRRTANTVWHDEDVLEIHPHDAEVRGITEGAWVKLVSRSGETSLRAHLTRQGQPPAWSTPPSTTPARRQMSSPPIHSDWATKLPGIQGDGGAGGPVERPLGLAGTLRGTGAAVTPHPVGGRMMPSRLDPCPDHGPRGRAGCHPRAARGGAGCRHLARHDAGGD